MNPRFWPFGRKKPARRPPGAGLTYCSGFDLVVRSPVPLRIEVEQWRRGGTDLNPPKKLGRYEVAPSDEDITLSISTDGGVLGHPCAEIFHLVLSLPSGEQVELELAETQTSQTARILAGNGWTADYPRFRGPEGLRLEYRPRHSFLD